MRDLRVLVVDDSAINRRTLADMLGQLPGVSLAGVAGDGDEALRLAAAHAPDLITLDLEMPRMDGFTFLRLLMASRPVPVLVISSHSAKDNVFRALELGAIDFIAKPDALLTGPLDSVREQLQRMVAMVRRLAPTQVVPRRAKTADAPTAHERTVKPVGAALKRGANPRPPHVIVIAASTGGPTALLDLFAQLPESGNVCVVVAQHMPERFTKAFAERLDRGSAFRVLEAESRQPLVAGQALICPGGKSLELDLESGVLVTRIVAAPEDKHHPSADRLFCSAARHCGDKALGIVLTGMGEDGAQGALAIKQAGGQVWVESEQSALIYGMPRATEQACAVDAVLALPELITKLAATIALQEEV